MQGIEVEIEEILLCREKRVKIQNDLIKNYDLPVISFTMNIPGPVKTNDKIKKAFDYGKKMLLDELEKNNIKILDLIELNQNTGNELFISVSSSAEKIKDITVSIEESSDLGRIFDIDVIDINEEKISRKKFRKCFICDKQAQECARSRQHSVEEMFKKIQELIEKNL